MILPKNIGWDLVSAPADWRAAEIQEAWQRLIGETPTPNALYRSPQWLDHLHATKSEEPCAVAVWRDPSGLVNGIAPLRLIREHIRFDVSGRQLAGVPLRLALVLGSLPLCPPGEFIHNQLCDAIVKAVPECDGIAINHVFQDSPLLGFLKGSLFLKKRFLANWPPTAGAFTVLPLPDSYEEFMAQFDKKKRYNLRRQERLLRDTGGGSFAFHRVVRADSVAFFVRALRAWENGAAQPRRQADGDWQRVETNLLDLAGRSLLKSFCITFGDVPVAFMLACQYGKTLYVKWTRFNPAYAHLSPGTTLFQMVLRDLIETDRVDEVQLGMGDPDLSHYKSYAYDLRQTTSCMLLRKSLANRALLASYRLFQAGKTWAGNVSSYARRLV